MSRDLRRHRLLTMIEQTPGLWLIDACAGSGKSRLARQLARQYDCEVSPKVTVTHDGGDPDPIIVDVGKLLWEPASDEIAFLLSRPDTSLTVIMSRGISDAGADLGAQVGARWLRSTDLWFDDDELAELGTLVLGHTAAPRFVKALRSLTDAWPSAVGACLDEARRAPAAGADFGPTARAAFNSVLDPVIQHLGKELSSHLETLSFFERFDSQMARVLGHPDLLDRLLEAGVPVLDKGRWSCLGAVTRATVRGRVQTSPEVSDQLLEHLAANGRLIEAVEAAADLGSDDTAARMLSQLGVDETHGLDAARTGAVTARLAAALDDHPRMHLVRARQHLGRGDLTNTIEALRIGVDATTNSAPVTPAAEEIQAELAYALYLSGDLDGARSQLPADDFEIPAARARQYQVIAGLDALTMEHRALERAARNYRIAEHLWVESGQALTAASVLTGLAMEVTSRTGRVNEALALVERVLPTAAAHPNRHTSVQLIRVRLLTLAGRHREAEALLHDVEGLVGIVLRGWMAAHVHQARALMASHRGDHELATRQITLAQRELGDLSSHAPGASLHCDAIDVFARLGDAVRANEHLAALRAHPGTEPPDLLWAEVLVSCRIGDAESGRQLAAEFRSGDIATPGGDWKLDFAESIAADRLGHSDQAATLLAKATQRAAMVGTPDIIDATEQRSAATPKPTTVTERCRVEVLGEFRVTVDEAVVQLPRGHAQTLLKLLALRSRKMTVDEMIDSLWPDGDPAVGRRRLRNVLSRVRAACGEIVDRDGELLRLADDVVTDFADWWDASVSALLDESAELDRLSELAAQAPDLLLPADRYEEWLQPLQQRYQLQLLRLLDTLAAAGGDASTNLAVEAQRRALEIDPWSIDRIEGAIALSRRAGRTREVEAFEELLVDLR